MVQTARTRANFPQTVEVHVLSISTRVADVTANTVMTFDFDASNAFGVEQGFTMRCIQTPSATFETELFSR